MEARSTSVVARVRVQGGELDYKGQQHCWGDGTVSDLGGGGGHTNTHLSKFAELFL